MPEETQSVDFTRNTLHATSCLDPVIHQMNLTYVIYNSTSYARDEARTSKGLLDRQFI